MFTPKSCSYQKSLMTEKFGLDTSRMNMTVITEIDLDKAISIISDAKAGLNISGRA